MKLLSPYASTFGGVYTITEHCDEVHDAEVSASRSEATTIRPQKNLKNRFITNDIDTAVVISWQ